jgi:hypothetical protein
MGAAESDHEGSPEVPPVVVPDDASALESDRRAWLAEERTKRRHARFRRMIFTRHWDQFGFSGPLVVIALLVTSIFGGLAVWLLPRQQHGTEAAPAPLSGVAVVRVTGADPPATETVGGGVLDHRLPTVTLDGDVRPVSLTDLRPAVIVATPPDCRCSPVIKEIFRQAREFRLGVWLVGTKGPGETSATPVRNRLLTLDEQGAGGGARWAVDSTGILTTTLVMRGMTLIAVRADGTVAALRRDMPLDPGQLPALEPLLATLIKRTG